MAGRPHKFDWEVMKTLLGQGKSPIEVAKELNVSVPAVRYAIKEKIKKSAVVSTITFEKGREVASRHLDTLKELQQTNEYTHEIRDLVIKAIRGDKNAIAILNIDNKFKRKDPLEIFVKVNAQVIEQLSFQSNIFKTLYTVQQIDEYQDEVEATMEEMEPGLRNKFLKRLKEKRLLHSATQWKDK